MNFLYRSYDLSVDCAYIIHLPGNQESLSMAQRCRWSCDRVGMPCQLYTAFDGTGTELKIPEHLAQAGWYRWLKVTDHHLSMAEIACALSHISLWVKCMEQDRPLVVLEHDAIMLKPYQTHPVYNAINYLGCKQQLETAGGSIIPPLSSINKNWYFINRAHAYAIDPAAAKNLFQLVLQRGIFESLDIMMKIDDVAVIQSDLYAYDEPGLTTIATRKKDTK